MQSQPSLRHDYLAMTPDLTRLKSAVAEQLNHLLTAHEVTLGVPLESRVKSWESIAEKVERKNLQPKRIDDLDDLVGLRAILLFQRDLDRLDSIVMHNFAVLQAEDTATRLSETQFGYKSKHYIVKLPTSWAEVPSLKGLAEYKIEIQIRTLAQHIWAAASHKLQYKNEDSVPQQLRRTIYRVSALLETVDLEFDRVLSERDEYVKLQAHLNDANEPLNADVVRAVLDQMLPPQNKDQFAEQYGDLLIDLLHFGISTRGALSQLLSKHHTAIARQEAKEVAERSMDDDHEHEEQGERLSNRLLRGVFFTHTGLARQGLCEEFGDEAVRQWQWSGRGGADA